MKPLVTRRFAGFAGAGECSTGAVQYGHSFREASTLRPRQGHVIQAISHTSLSKIFTKHRFIPRRKRCPDARGAGKHHVPQRAIL